MLERTRSRRWLWLALLIGCVICARHTALAMGIRESKRQLARSPAGAILYEVLGYGPEGGGSIGYRVVARPRGRGVDFVMSSTFGPGDGSEPQTVSADECRRRVDALGGELAKRRIPGVTLHPEACRTERRAGLVVVASGREP